MIDLSNLEDVGGSAQHIPELLEELKNSRDPEILDELWQRLCHQGSVYSASFAALPELVKIAEQWHPSNDCLDIISLATSILTGEDGDNLRRPSRGVESEESQEWTTTVDRIDINSPTRDRYQTEIDTLLRLSETYLQQPILSAGDFVDLLSSIARLKGYHSWGEALEYFALSWIGWGGYCARCGEFIYIYTTDESAIAEVEKTNSQTLQTFLDPVPAESLTGIARWLYNDACDRGFDLVAQKITYILGTGSCPQCGADFQVPKIMEFTELLDS
jgi:hypothetical protein